MKICLITTTIYVPEILKLYRKTRPDVQIMAAGDRNLRDEMYGMEHTDRFVEDLVAIDIGNGSLLRQLLRIYPHLAGKDYIPKIVHKIGNAWCDDVERALESTGLSK